MAGAGVLVATGVAGPTTKAYSLWINGTDLVGYLDWHAISIEMSARPGDNSRATFRLENFDGTLNFTSFWGMQYVTGIKGGVGYPLMEVRLYDHVHQEPLFGGYIVGLRSVIAYASKSTVEVTCVGYSWILDATFTKAQHVFLTGDNIGPAIPAGAADAGLRGGVRASSGFFGDLATDDSIDNTQAFFNDVIVAPYTPLRQAIMQLVGATGGQAGIWVDNFKRLCVLDDQSWASTAPLQGFGTTNWAERLEQVVDFTEYATRVYIQSSTAEGQGWYEARMLDGPYSVAPNDPQDGTTYQPPIDIDVTVSQDGATEAFSREVYGASELGVRQMGNVPVYVLTKTGTFGWRLGQGTDLAYPAFWSGSISARVVVIAYRLSFASPSQPVFELTLGAAHQWGTGGFGSSVADAAATSAEYAKRRLTVRTS
jgi:hypothetical protein